MKLSIVATLFCSQPYIEKFYERAVQAGTAFTENEDFEIIFVNDGSPDKGLEVAIKLAEKDSRITVIDLSRNFGHHYAIMTGLRHTKGDYIFLIDSDLEEEPEWLQLFSQQMQVDNCDVVFGVQEKRKGRLAERFSGWLFYTLFNNLTGLALPRNAVTARLMTRAYLNALLLHQEKELSIGGLFLLTGFNQKPLTITKHSSSKSVYTFSRKLSIAVNSVVSLSNRPLVGIFLIGMGILLLSIMISIFYITNALLLGQPPSGWTSLMISVWILGGLIISSIGIVGVYIAKIFTETKNRPLTIIRQIYNKDRESSNN